jgi:hypothetical protein
MKKKREAIVMCGRVENTPVVVEGSTKDVCVKCDAEIWVSPTSRRLEGTTGKDGEFFENVKMVCVECCLMGIAQGDTEVELEPLSDKQKAELQEAIGADAEGVEAAERALGILVKKAAENWPKERS